MKIVSWNINSVRLRIDQVTQFLRDQQPDVLCLQELKCPDEHFPHEAFEALGYKHRHVHGMKSYNGVAILSKLPFTNTEIKHFCAKEDRRHCMAAFENGVEVHNFYIPAGGDEPDPAINDKFAHKLSFLQEMTQWWTERLQGGAGRKAVLVGDFNIAPSEFDVWSHKQLLKVVSHTPVEVEALELFRKSGDFIDAVREIYPEPEKLYSWWSYRSRDWRQSNKGRRLDHVWMTPEMAGSVAKASVYDTARDWVKPSDHAPVIVEFKI
ncbi:exodeoxyribonuclease III [Thalassospira sp. TSL5-1]|uniref:exodeoxyribonuclease III n=1 Tax=Thalassospira sp. TSL5-1 TaxID=1544451 RepID=UPI00093C167F|nr:exodeoxyribonuclease III [Thalassospira sp. TSL5-1]OKH88843.1 exodeoxyribonuclease III [Thalassospira sp. TSL5-1]